MAQTRVPTVEALSLPDGRKVTVRRWPGRGRQLVLLHGLLDSSYGWDDLCRSTHRPCLAFDLPGFGDSDRVSRPRISAYADDVIAALDAAGASAFTLVGHSLGGAVATAVAERVPDRVQALVLLAPAGFGRQPLAEAASLPGVRGALTVGLPLALANPVVLTATYSTMVANFRLPARDFLSRTARRAHAAGPGASDAVQALMAAGRSPRALYKRQVAYEGPVRALWGSADRLVPRAHIRGLKNALPQAQVSMWKGMGHHPQHERPDQLARMIEQACCKTRPRRARRRRPRAQLTPLAA